MTAEVIRNMKRFVAVLLLSVAYLFSYAEDIPYELLTPEIIAKLQKFGYKSVNYYALSLYNNDNQDNLDKTKGVIDSFGTDKEACGEFIYYWYSLWFPMAEKGFKENVKLNANETNSCLKVADAIHTIKKTAQESQEANKLNDEIHDFLESNPAGTPFPSRFFKEDYIILLGKDINKEILGSYPHFINTQIGIIANEDGEILPDPLVEESDSGFSNLFRKYCTSKVGSVFYNGEYYSAPERFPAIIAKESRRSSERRYTMTRKSINDQWTVENHGSTYFSEVPQSIKDYINSISLFKESGAKEHSVIIETVHRYIELKNFPTTNAIMLVDYNVWVSSENCKKWIKPILDHPSFKNNWDEKFYLLREEKLLTEE